MNRGLSDQVRACAKVKYVQPEFAAGNSRFSISVKELSRDQIAAGFPTNHARQVCMALRSKKFLLENDLEIVSMDGPKSKISPTVVVHYRFTGANAQNVMPEQTDLQDRPACGQETSEAWANRLTEKIRGLLKEELKEYGGGETFLRWIRSEDRRTAKNAEVDAA